MGEFNGFAVGIGEQLEGMKGWKNPMSHAVVEPVLFQCDDNGLLKFLIARRLKGAFSVATEAKGGQPAKISLHPGGGFITPNLDDTPYDTVIRSVYDKLGYAVLRGAVAFAGTAGPALNLSSLRARSRGVRLVIHDQPAEPKVPFTAQIFAVNMSAAKKERLGNGSLEELGWFTPQEIAEQFGENCIYPTFLQVAKDVIFCWGLPGQTALWRPGEYTF